jgi:alpha/beta superfamily hydrolase
MRIGIRCGDLYLEGDLSAPARCTRGAVVCHPHPQYGGDMDNPVVRAVAAALEETGCVTLRFNFRGVGGSAGSYAGGVGELDDAHAAVRALMEQTAVPAITLAGYSFGAMIGLQAGAVMPEVDRLVAVAPPLAFFDLGCVAACAKPKLFVAGDRDQYCNVDTLARELSRLVEPKTCRLVAGADHFFFGHEAGVAEAVRSFAATP